MRHLIFWLWWWFAVGWALHVLKVAYDNKRSRYTPWQTLGQFFAANWVAVVIRFALTAAIFALWRTRPDFLVAALGKLGLNLAVDVPLNRMTGFVFGYLADSVLDFLVQHVPLLQRQVPMYAPTEPEPAKADAAAAGGPN